MGARRFVSFHGDNVQESEIGIVAIILKLISWGWGAWGWIIVVVRCCQQGAGVYASSHTAVSSVLRVGTVSRTT